MTALDTAFRPVSLAERAAAALGKPLPVAEKICLLLDVSGSMNDAAEPGVRKIDALRSLASGLTAPYMYAFSRLCRRCTRESIPIPDGGTALHLAFLRLRGDGITRAVLITDGLPDDEAAAIREVCGLALEIYYVGPAPKPEFLDRLARAAKAGSAAHMATLAGAGRAALGRSVRLLLAAPR